jgi:cation:H+ antiporter
VSGASLLLFFAGLVLLVGGANALVRGASGLAAALGAPPLTIGLTVVAFGTSSPEVVVSVQSAMAGQSQIALGNVVGSNIFNVLFILGVSALIAPLVVSEQLVRLDVPIMILSSSLVLLLGMNGSLGRLEATVLLLGILCYTGMLMWMARRGDLPGADSVSREDAEKPHNIWLDWVRIIVGLALLVFGSHLLVNGAIEIATRLGVSSLVIGLTIVAAGTSLPEVATSIAASVRGERDIAVGNVVGSNIFNSLFVLGTAAMVAPNGLAVPAPALTFDMPVMIAVSIACLPIFFTGYRIGRREGAVFLLYYIAYTAFLVLDATDHEAKPIFTGIMLSFVLPLTGLTLAAVTWRAWRTSRHSRKAGNARQRDTADR